MRQSNSHLQQGCHTLDMHMNFGVYTLNARPFKQLLGHQCLCCVYSSEIEIQMQRLSIKNIIYPHCKTWIWKTWFLTVSTHLSSKRHWSQQQYSWIVPGGGAWCRRSLCHTACAPPPVQTIRNFSTRIPPPLTGTIPSCVCEETINILLLLH